MTTIGMKTVVVAYNKTKQGEYTKAVSTIYKLEVTNPVVSLEVTTMPLITTYYYFNADPIIFNTTGLVVTATYSDGTKTIIPNSSLQFGKIPAATGSQGVLISYAGATKTVSTTCPLTLVKGIGQVGNTDFSSAGGPHSPVIIRLHRVQVKQSPCTATPITWPTGTAHVPYYAKPTRLKMQ